MQNYSFGCYDCFENNEQRGKGILHCSVCRMQEIYLTFVWPQKTNNIDLNAYYGLYFVKFLRIAPIAYYIIFCK